MMEGTRDPRHTCITRQATLEVPYPQATPSSPNTLPSGQPASLPPSFPPPSASLNCDAPQRRRPWASIPSSPPSRLPFRLISAARRPAHAHTKRKRERQRQRQTESQTGTDRAAHARSTRQTATNNEQQASKQVTTTTVRSVRQRAAEGSQLKSAATPPPAGGEEPTSHPPAGMWPRARCHHPAATCHVRGSREHALSVTGAE